MSRRKQTRPDPFDTWLTFVVRFIVQPLFDLVYQMVRLIGQFILLIMGRR